jgi:hypothetical protein
MHYVIINDQVVPSSEVKKPLYQGLEHIIGKKTNEDRKFVSKVDPTLVTEMINGEMKTHKPIMTYGEILEPRTHWSDSLTVNGACILLGAGTVLCLYYWGIVQVFAK